jgi:hypothetical protein
MDHLWIVFMSASVVLQGLQNALPHYAPMFTAAEGACFQMACLFANPAAALEALKNVSFARPTAPTPAVPHTVG